MLNRLAYRYHQSLERHFPEQRLFLKSDTETRFIRLRPATQIMALVGGTLALAWTIVATALIMMDSIGAGSAREQSVRQQALYEERLNALSTDRDLRAEEAVRAQERFNIALAQVSDMQERLLASEERRQELETGIEAVQDTLRTTIKERDGARAEAERMTLALSAQSGAATELGRASDTLATLEFLTGALGEAALERNRSLSEAAAAREEARRVADAKQAMQLRNDAIFAKLEEALTVSVEPLDRMFREVGMSPEALIDSVREGYSGQGGPLTPITFSTSGAAPAPEELRANAILGGLDRLNMYRIAAGSLPLAMPVRGNFRMTSRLWSSSRKSRIRLATTGPTSGTVTNFSVSASMIAGRFPKNDARLAAVASPTSRIPSAYKKRESVVDLLASIALIRFSADFSPIRSRSASSSFVSRKMSDGFSMRSSSTNCSINFAPSPSISIARRDTKCFSASTR